MQYRTIPKTGEKVSALGLGAMRLTTNAGTIDRQKAKEEIKYAIDCGINIIDTAYMYGGGDNERAVGEILEELNYRDKVNISTKLNFRKIKTREDIYAMFNEELERLRTDHIDFYFLHSLVEYKNLENLIELGLFEFIEEKKASGEIRNIGFSFHGSYDEFIKLVDAYEWDMCMVQFNYADERYQAGIEGIKYLASKNIAVFIMEPLKGGLLAGQLPDVIEADIKQYNTNKSNAELALSWIFNYSEITCVYSGMNSIEMIEENIKIVENATPNSLNSDELELINNIGNKINELSKINCTTCNYCMPCPYGVNIPECFKLYNERFLFNTKLYGINHSLAMYVFNLLGLSGEAHDASLCKNCGVCVSKCPQHIDIPKELRNVDKKFHRRLLKPLVPLINRIMKLM
ncbi:aldo/keto reductase [Methanosphaera sp.]